MKFQDYYQTLGISRTASADEIKRAYRKLALEWHPDRHPPDKRPAAEVRFKQISEANDVLSDPEKRKRYDALGPDWQHGQDFKPPPGGGFRNVSPEEFERMFGGRGGNFGGGGFSDFFAQMFGDLFSGGGGAGGGGDGARPRQRQRGQDIEAELPLAAGIALLGGKHPFELSANVPCERCDGEGRIGRHACPACSGLGHLRRRRTVDLNIPSDVYDGQVLRLRGLGEPGAGEPGDLLLKLQFADDEVYRLRGDHLEADVVVAPWEALDGAKVDVQVPGGVASARIPPATRPGSKLRLKGQGLAHRDGSRGDLYLVVRIGLPHDLTPRQQELLRELGKEGGSVRGGARLG